MGVSGLVAKPSDRPQRGIRIRGGGGLPKEQRRLTRIVLNWGDQLAPPVWGPPPRPRPLNHQLVARRSSRDVRYQRVAPTGLNVFNSILALPFSGVRWIITVPDQKKVDVGDHRTKRQVVYIVHVQQ